ncbi:MAG: NAD(P)-dependent glycerol-3-phosphate dehydrogenase [Alphaproteobacteria bacterium]|nr:NAD(P)-dependent glycerol-3-phosphate dehydrogenase [Alphaproteobacteria bacterium]
MARIGIIGGGAWGTALGLVAARAGHDVRLWAREPDVVEIINARHENSRFLSGVTLHPAINASAAMGDIMGWAELVALVAPAQHVRAVAGLIRATPSMPPLLVCAKGIEQNSGLLMSEVLEASVPGAPLSVLSGPTFAREVAEGKPTAVTIAGRDTALARRFAEAFGGRSFRPYVSDDLVGAQVGGAVKNVLAIAAGIAIGRGLGENARAALITRGFAEMTRLALAKGARAETLAGLSGLGDLVLTAGSDQSRNFALGRALGAGTTLAAHLAGRDSVAEGAASAPAVVALGAKLNVELPIAQAVDAVLHRGAAIDEAIGALLARPFKTER